MSRKIELIFIQKSEAKAMIVPSYQRKLSNGMVKKISAHFDNANGWDIPPVVINDNYEIIDGQHRVAAYLASSATFKIAAIRMSGSGKKDFLLFNEGKAVTTAHKIMIHEKIINIKDNFNISISPSTISSINASDLMKSVGILYKKKCLSPTKEQIFFILDTISEERLFNLVEKVVFIKNKYIEALTAENKFKQKWLLFYVFMSSAGLLKNSDFERTVNRLPNTSGGDISLFQARAEFIDIFNYRLHNRNKIDIFDR